MSGIKVKQRLCPRKVDLDRSDFRSLCNDDDDDDDDFQPSTSLGRREWESNTDDDDDDGETNSTGESMDGGDDDDDDDDDDDGDDDDDDDDDNDGGGDSGSSDESDEESDLISDGGDRDDEVTKSGQEYRKNGNEQKQETPSKKSRLMTGKNSAKKSNEDEMLQTECPICLLEFSDQLIGRPESCRHLFCSDCIKEWSKNVNSCPIDRQKFNIIWIKTDVNGPTIEELFVEDACPKVEEFEEPPTFCQICNMCDREDVMLLCDGCDNGYHMYCLNPALEHVPVDDWYCPRCTEERQPASIPAAASATPQSVRITRRRGARTVAETTNFARAARAWFSGEADANLTVFIGYRPRGARSRSYSRTKKRKSTKNAKKKDSRNKKEPKKRKKRRISKRKKQPGLTTGATAKQQSKRKMRKKKEKKQHTQEGYKKENGNNRLSMLGSASLEPTLSFSLFGNKYDLDEFCEEPVETGREKSEEPKKSTNPHLLTEIIHGFDKLDSDNVIINRDGSLLPKGKRNDDDNMLTGSSNEGGKFGNRRKKREREKEPDQIDNNHRSKSSRLGEYDLKNENCPTSKKVLRYQERNIDSLKNGSQHVLNVDSDPKKPSADEIKHWRNLVDKDGYKPLPDAKKFRSFKIPKVAKKEQDTGAFDMKNSNEIKRTKEKDNGKRNEGAERRDYLPKRNYKASSRSSESNKQFEDIENGELIEDKGLSHRITTGRNAKIPDRLTPRTYTRVSCDLIDERKKKRKISNDEKWKEGRKPPRNCRAGECFETVATASRNSQNDIDKGGESSKQCLVQDSTSISNRLRVEENGNYSDRKFAESKVFVNKERMNGSVKVNHKTKIVADELKHNNNLKERRTSVSKKIADIDSDDDESENDDKNDYTYEESLLNRNEKIKERRREEEKESFKLKIDSMNNKRTGLLETSPKHYADFENGFRHEKHFGNSSIHNRICKKTNDATSERDSSDKKFERPIALVSPIFYESTKISNSSSNSHPLLRESLKRKQAKNRKREERVQRQIHAVYEAKKALKPYFMDKSINKDEYKLILKRSVDKIVASDSHITSEKVEKLILKYIFKLKGVKTNG